MSLNVTQIQQYIPALSNDMAVKAVAESTTAKLLASNGALQTGVKGKASILKLSQDVNLQDGSVCGARNPLGTTSLGNVFITATQLKDESNICPKTLYNSYFAYAISKGQNPQEETLLPEFLKHILELKASMLNLSVENLIWHGDSTLTGANPLKWFDGLVKQITAAGSGYKSLSAITGDTIVEKLQAAFSAMPVEVRSQPDFRIFIGQDMYDQYTIALANKNIYKPTGDSTLFGTTAILLPTSGLNGSNEIVAARISNFHLAMDGDAEVDKVIMNFSIETNQWYLDYHFAVGVAVVYPSEIGYVKLT